MAKKNRRIYTLLGAAVGTGLAVYGIRQGMRWYQRQQLANRFGTQFPESSWSTERRYQPIEQPDMEQIPVSGSLTTAPPMTGMTTAERVNSDKVSDFDDRGTAFSTTEMNRVEAGEEDSDIGSKTGSKLYGVAGVTSGISEPGDRQTGARTGQPFNTDQYTSSQSSAIVLDEFVASLIEHAIAFNSVITLLGSRQRDGEGYEGTKSLTDGDRTSMRAVLDQMQEHVTEFDETDLRKNPLALRSFKLTSKLRDALDNLDYTGSDLYSIHKEVSQELCGLARDLEKSGQVTITGLDHIRQLYECQ